MLAFNITRAQFHGYARLPTCLKTTWACPPSIDAVINAQTPQKRGKNPPGNTLNLIAMVRRREGEQAVRPYLIHLLTARGGGCDLHRVWAQRWLYHAKGKSC